MFFFFSNDNAISIFPLGSNAILKPKSTGELREYLDDALGKWREVHKHILDNSSESPQQSGATKKASSQIERIQHFRRIVRAISRNVKTLELTDKLLSLARATLADSQSVWVDVSSRSGSRYVDALRSLNIAEADNLMEMMVRDWSSTHASLIEKYRSDPTLQDLSAGVMQVLRVAGADLNYVRRLVSERKTDILAIKSVLSSMGADIKKSKHDLEQLRAEAKGAETARAIDIAQAVNQISELQRDAKSIEERSNSISRSLERQDAELAVIRQAIEAAKTGAEKTINEFSRSLNDRLLLKEASKYWQEKSKAHAIHAYGAFSVFVGLVLALLLLAYTHAETIWLALSLLQDAGSEKTINFFGIVIVSIPTLLIVWILRHLSRYFINHFAQLSDAQQRSVMMATYLALVADEKSGVSKQERVLILNALFRPVVSSGQDDASPAAFLESLIKSGDAKKAAPSGS